MIRGSPGLPSTVSQNEGMSEDDATTELPAVVLVELEPPAEPDPTPGAPPRRGHRRAVRRHAAPSRPRLWPWVVLGAVALALLLGAAGAVWYVSGLIGDGARIARPIEAFPMEVTAVDGSVGLSYSGSTGDWDDQGLMGISTIEGGYAQTDQPLVTGSGDAASGSRRITNLTLPPSPAVGDRAAMDGWYFPRNPKVALGLDYQDVTYDSPLGPTPAWLIPGTASTWVIYVHDAGATPLEGLRVAESTTALGYPTMLIKYRNDAQAPAGNGYGRFGVDEWQDLEAAVRFAVDRGAEHVVLAGAGMGGAITMAFLQHSSLADRVSGAFLDSPVSDLSHVVHDRAARSGVPSPLTSLAMRVASWRFDLDWEATDYTASAAKSPTPTVIVQGTADTVVPPQVNADYAEAADPSVVRLELFTGAGHDLSWNVDRTRYEHLLTDFLGRVAPVG
jgi:uncharacterized protein